MKGPLQPIRNANPYILVSAVRANTIKSGWRKPIPVMVRVNGKPDRQWRINMMPVGNGDFYLYLHGVFADRPKLPWGIASES
jgi:hypothetical protein